MTGGWFPITTEPNLPQAKGEGGVPVRKAEEEASESMGFTVPAR